MVSPIAPALVIGQPHLTEHGLVKLKMVHRLPYNQNVYAEGNTIGYSKIVEATLHMQYVATIAPFKRSRNGRGSYLALKYHFVGLYHWYQDIKDPMKLLVNRKWTGKTGFSLQAFLSHHFSS